jgi:hypothetical protein
MTLIIKNYSKLIARYVFVALIINLIRFYIVILVILVFILRAMDFRKYQKRKFIIVIAVNFKRNITIKK